MVAINIDESILEDMLIERLNKLYDAKWMGQEEYDNYADEIHQAVYQGWFDGCDLDIKSLVDNLVVSHYHLLPQQRRNNDTRQRDGTGIQRVR